MATIGLATAVGRLDSYHNLRSDYIDAWWNVVNWPHVAESFAAVS